MNYGPPYNNPNMGYPQYGVPPHGPPPPMQGYPPTAFEVQIPMPHLPPPIPHHHQQPHRQHYQTQNHIAHQAQYENIAPIYQQQYSQYPHPVLPQHPKQYSQPPPPRPSLPQPPPPPPPPPVPVQQTYAPAPPVALPEPPASQLEPVDPQELLLSLAEEYLSAAREEGSVSLTKKGVDQERYYKCIATGLGCLETVLSKWRLHPRHEAAVRLRYASVLFEETENYGEAELNLTKGITLCERNRLLDLKYTMQHLLARVTFQKNPRAALKALDGIIRDIEAYQHISWAYAFRFLRVSLSLELGSPTDTSAALQHLRSISALASSRGDQAVYVLSSILEALAHLRSGNADSIEQAQRAIAAARSLQLERVTVDCPQLVALIHILDLCCSLVPAQANLALPKMQSLRSILDNQPLPDAQQRKPFPADGTFAVPVFRGSTTTTSLDSSTTGGILSSAPNATHDSLHFSWLPARELYILGYYLDAVTTSHRNSQDGHKAETSLEEGLKMARSQPPTAPEWLTWRATIQAHLRTQLIFLRCARSDWASAKKLHARLRTDSLSLPPSSPSTHAIELLTAYLSAVILQGTGELDKAIEIYQSPTFALAQFPHPSSHPSSTTTTTTAAASSSSSSSSTTTQKLHLSLSLLSTLSTILILRPPTSSQSEPTPPPCHPSLPSLFASLEPFFPSPTSPHHQQSTNPHLYSLYHLTLATSHPTSSGIIRKNDLQAALTAAKLVANTQLTAITLNFMSWKYFRGVVGEQAEKSARAGWRVAQGSGDRLWVAVGGGMLGETLVRVGKGEEGGMRMAEAVALSGEIRRDLGVDEGGA